MFQYVQAPVASGGLGSALSTYFAAVPGVYKPVGGATPCAGGSAGIMNSDACQGVTNGWRALDGGKWWLRSSAYSEPNGNYDANSYLLFAGWYSALGLPFAPSADNLYFDDGGSVSSGSNYLCSTNDFNTGTVRVSCLEILTRNPGAQSGTYTIVTSNNRLLSVWCDMTTDGGGYDVMHAVRSWFRLFALFRCVLFPW
jgi:hypothetical protein